MKPKYYCSERVKICQKMTGKSTNGGKVYKIVTEEKKRTMNVSVKRWWESIQNCD